jgi:nucleotide-binding universal stress UspA family protein
MVSVGRIGRPIDTKVGWTSLVPRFRVFSTMGAPILCAVELAPLAPRVVALAALFARAKGASVVVLHVRDRHDPDAEAERRLERLVERPRADGIPVTVVVEEGDPARLVLRRSAGAVGVVMGTHGCRGVERLMLGSVAERVLDHAPCPVATVRGAFHAEIHRILCGVDLEDESPLDAALALARELHAEVIALHSVPEVRADGKRGLVPASYCPELLAEAKERLGAAIAAVDTSGIDVRPVVAAGRPHAQLVRYAAEESAGLVVVGVHPRLFGSTTHHVVREAACPVLTVRRAAFEEGDR